MVQVLGWIRSLLEFEPMVAVLVIFVVAILDCYREFGLHRFKKRLFWFRV